MVILGAWPTTFGLYLGTAVFAIGMSLLYPAIFLLTLHRVPSSERASAIGTLSSFFDLSQGLGAAICGGTQVLLGYRGMFLVTAGFAVVGTGYFRVITARRD